MKRPIYSRPEAFSLSPLLLLLPVKGRIGKLEGLTSSLFARYEKVIAMQREIEGGSSDTYKKVSAEQLMLKQVLDWLSIRPED